MTAPATAFIGLGGNLGDVPATLRAALAALAALPGTSLLRTSRFYRTPAWGREDQPAFVNAVSALETTLSAEALLGAMLAIERDHGRERETADARWGPRTLDLDLLLYGDAEIDLPGLRVPHPHLRDRAFVLVPLAEIAPDWPLPGGGSVGDALAAIASDGIDALP